MYFNVSPSKNLTATLAQPGTKRGPHHYFKATVFLEGALSDFTKASSTPKLIMSPLTYRLFLVLLAAAVVFLMCLW